MVAMSSAFLNLCLLQLIFLGLSSVPLYVLDNGIWLRMGKD